MSEQECRIRMIYEELHSNEFSVKRARQYEFVTLSMLISDTSVCIYALLAIRTPPLYEPAKLVSILEQFVWFPLNLIISYQTQ